MALNTRSGFDPRFAFFARVTAMGFMICRVRVYSSTLKDITDEVLEWDPTAGTAPAGDTTFTVIYEGPGRVQPNQDWRARATSMTDETVVIHNTRIQLPFDGNEIGDKSFPDIRVNDVVRVIDTFALDGVQVDPLLTDFIHIVGNVVPSSNSWVRTLSCNTDMTKVGVLDA